MLSKHTYGDLVWVDIENPTKDEVLEVMAEYSLHPGVAEELLSPTLKPRVDATPEYLYLVLHFPAFKHTHHIGDEQEVDFIIGKDFIITTRYETIDPLHKFSKMFEVNAILEKHDVKGIHAGFVFVAMMKKLYTAIEHEMEALRDDLEQAEELIFAGHEKEMVFFLSEIGRTTLNLKQTLSGHKEVLLSLESAGGVFFGKEFSPQLRYLSDEYHRINERVETHGEWLKELRETNQSLLFTKQNEIMKVLTIMAFVTFPLTLITSIFGMNTDHLPIVGMAGDFWIILSFMGLLAMSFFAFFRYKNWL